MKRTIFICRLAVVAMLSVPFATIHADDDIVVTRNEDGSWTFTKPAGKSVSMEVEYYTQEELDQAAAQAVSIRSSAYMSNNRFTMSVRGSTSDGGVLNYQWYSNDVASNYGGEIIEGATSSRYVPPTDKVVGKYFYCVVTNDNGVGVGQRTTKVLSKSVKRTTSRSTRYKRRSRRR